MMSTMLKYTDRADVDLVTNVQVRTFPIGHSVEMINSGTFAGIDGSQLTDEEKEHVTKVYYRHPSDYRIINIEGADPGLAGMSLAVDTFEDLCRLERISSLDGE
jgi:spore coat polysaccharide biosynthesis protein SpsF